MPNPVPDTVVCEIVRFEPPVLLRATDCDTVLPITTLLKFTGEGLGASCPVAVAANRKIFNRTNAQLTCVDGGPKRFTSVLLFRASGSTAGYEATTPCRASEQIPCRRGACIILSAHPRIGQVSKGQDGTRKCRTLADFGRVKGWPTGQVPWIHSPVQPRGIECREDASCGCQHCRCAGMHPINEWSPRGL